MNAEISETIRATILGLGIQIHEIPAQRKFVSKVHDFLEGGWGFNLNVIYSTFKFCATVYYTALRRSFDIFINFVRYLSE